MPDQTPEILESLKPPQMPALARAASQAAIRAQAVARMTTRLALILLVLSVLPTPFAQSGIAFPVFRILDQKVNVFQAIAVGTFVFAAALRIVQLIRNPEREWRAGRSIAERARSLAWRYAVGGAPFGKSQLTDIGADSLFGEYLRRFIGQARIEGIHLTMDQMLGHADGITDWMKETHQLSLDDRRSVYAAHRIGSQLDFSKARATLNKRAGQNSQIIVLLIQFSGGILALLRLIHAIEIDLTVVVFAIATASTSWIQFNQFSALSGEYEDSAFELDNYQWYCTRSGVDWTEEDWSAFVDEVETYLGNKLVSQWRPIEPRIAPTQTTIV